MMKIVSVAPAALVCLVAPDAQAAEGTSLTGVAGRLGVRPLEFCRT